jgi:hypothetical protein
VGPQAGRFRGGGGRLGRVLRVGWHHGGGWSAWLCIRWFDGGSGEAGGGTVKVQFFSINSFFEQLAEQMKNPEPQ